MKAFGIELRKSGSQSIYEDVDLVLKGQSFQMVQRQAVAHSLQKMMRQESWFDICTIRNCVEVCQVHIPKERYDVYQAIHCVRWNEMLPDFRTMIVAMVLDDFREVLTMV